MTESHPRNILLILTDEHRRDTLGCYGNRICDTGNLDSLAGRGVLFENAFTPTAVCTPARASLLTGVYPQKHLQLTNIKKTWGPPVKMNTMFPPFSRYLGEAGYNLGTVGKWHIEDDSPERFGYEGLCYPGWDEPRGHSDYLEYLKDRGLPDFTVHGEIHGILPTGRPATTVAGIYDGPVEGTFTYYLAERTIERLRRYADDYRRSSRPFYLGMHIFGPHLPYYLPKRYANLYDPGDVILPRGFEETFANKPHVHRIYSQLWACDSYTLEQWRKIIAMYWGYVTMIDEQIGRILRVLDDLGLEEETAVFFTSDHGSFEGNHRLNDKGPAAYDDIYRVAFLARLPGGPRAGEREERFVTLMDLAATFIDLAGLPPPAHLDGRSLLPLLRGEEVPDWRTDVYMEFHGHQVPFAQRIVRTKDYKLVANLTDLHELYDLRRDPDELANTIDDPAYGDIKRELYGLLCGHLRKLDDVHALGWLEELCDVGEDSGG